MSTQDKAARIEGLRQRYLELKSAGQTHAPKSFPSPSALPARPIDDAAMIHAETVPAGWYWTSVLAKGDILRIVNRTGKSAVAFTCWNKADPTERFYHGDTVKIQWTARLSRGRLLLSEMGRVLASITEDSNGFHDVLMGGSNAASASKQFGPGSWRNTRDNLIGAVSKFGLGKGDIPPVISFFAAVATDETGGLHWQEGKRRPGDYVELRAEQDLFVTLSNCPHPLDPATAFDPGDVEIVRYRGRPATDGDLARTATIEAVRAFHNTQSPLLT